MMMKSVFWWRKPEYPEETTDLRQVTDETFQSEAFYDSVTHIECARQLHLLKSQG